MDTNARDEIQREWTDERVRAAELLATMQAEIVALRNKLVVSQARLAAAEAK